MHHFILRMENLRIKSRRNKRDSFLDILDFMSVKLILFCLFYLKKGYIYIFSLHNEALICLLHWLLFTHASYKISADDH